MNQFRVILLSMCCLLLLTSSMSARVRNAGPRLWNLAQEFVEQEADFLLKNPEVPVTITTSGVYRLAENLNTGGTTGTRVTIDANDVTLDLNGKIISTGAIGVATAANRSNITIKNGLISSCSSTGIAIGSGCSNVTIQDIQVKSIGTGLAGTGISLSSTTNSKVTRCIVTDTLGVGLRATSSQRLIIEDSTFSNNTVNGMVINQCSRSSVSGCTFSANTQEGLLITNGSNNLVVDSCIALDNTNHGFSLVSSNTVFLKQCQSIGNARSTNVAGFATQSGYGNIFEECIANGMVTTSTNADEFAAGFALLGTEQCSKIINSESANITTPVGGNSIPYGIFLQSSLGTITTYTATLIRPGKNNGWSPDDNFIAASDFTANSIILYEYQRNINTIIKRFEIAHGADINAASWSPDGLFLAIGGVAGNGGFQIRVYEFDKINKTLTELPLANQVHGADVESVSWSPDGKFLAIGGAAGTGAFEVRVYEFNSTTNILTLATNATHGATVNVVEWSPNGTFLGIGGVVSGGARIRVYEFDASNKILTLTNSQDPGNTVNDISWSFDTNFFAGVTSFQAAASELFVYRFNQISKVLTLVSSQNHSTTNSLFSVDWSPDGKFVAVSGSSGGGETATKISPFDRNRDALLAPTTVAGAGVFGRKVIWSSDGKLLLGGTLQGGATNALTLYSVLAMPQKNVITNNTVYCVSGNQYSTGVGIAGSSVENLITSNTAYNNNFNYQFITNAFTSGLNTDPGALQNVSIPPV